MNELDKKINEYFPGTVVRKDLVKTVKGNAIVPSYVLEYLLAQYCATSDEDTIQSGIETVKEILRKHYVHRNEANFVRSEISRKGRLKVIDRVSVEFNPATDCHEAAFANLQIKKVLIDSDTVKKHKKLLVGGVWCISEIEYIPSEDKKICPWILNSIKPIQMSHFDFFDFVEHRKNFNTEEWIDSLIQTIGFNPEMFGKRSKLTQLIRLIPYCERNYNLIELGPKGTGKSHIYSEFSPHGILVSGGEVSVPKLFVNNSSGKVGLVGYWDAVAFDEFAGKKKRVDKALVDIMKNYMANKSFSRGVETLGAEASMVFVGNTQHSLAYMLMHSDLFCELPERYYDSAFLDRLHFYIPGWEVDVIRGEMFTNGYGFVVDYLAEALRCLRNEDYSNKYKEHFTLSNDISTRDRDGINKTFSGLMKILYPGGEADKDEIEEILKFAIEGRKRVKDQLMRIDNTYPDTDFSYKNNSDNKNVDVETLEEIEYPQHYKKNQKIDDFDTESVPETAKEASFPTAEDQGPKEGHLTIKENQRGISFNSLFRDYLKAASQITITDPYIRKFYQARNLMEVIEVVIDSKPDSREVKIHLVTIADDFNKAGQEEYFCSIQKTAIYAGVKFTWEFDSTNTIHARHIVTDSGWKITLDRGLDIFQQYNMNDAFALNNRMQKYRSCKAFEVTYLKQK
ncbi:MAG: BREX system Lon protease-like protein BrxL [Victivallales bacterium]|nr:BREX system Lon protease-like protein BrxL [Victivallales bacterium]